MKFKPGDKARIIQCNALGGTHKYIGTEVTILGLSHYTYAPGFYKGNWYEVQAYDLVLHVHEPALEPLTPTWQDIEEEFGWSPFKEKERVTA